MDGLCAGEKKNMSHKVLTFHTIYGILHSCHVDFDYNYYYSYSYSTTISITTIIIDEAYIPELGEDGVSGGGQVGLLLLTSIQIVHH
jgi:hypothetical protein